MARGRKGLNPFTLKTRFPDAPVEFSPVGTSFEPARSSYDIVDVGDKVTFVSEPMDGYPRATRVYATHDNKGYPIGWVAEDHVDGVGDPCRWEGVIDVMYDASHSRDPGCVVLLNMRPGVSTEGVVPPF